MRAEIRKNIPAGKFRVAAIDPCDHSTRLVKDYDSMDKAFKRADKLNRQRVNKKDEVFYVYNDQGEFLRGEESVKKPEGKRRAVKAKL